MRTRTDHNQPEQVQLYVQRTASECMNATADFVRGSWRTLLSYSLLFLLPVAVVQSRGVVWMIANLIEDTDGGMTGSLTVTLIMLVVGFWLVNALVWGMMQLHTTRNGGLNDLKWHEAWPVLRRTLWRMVPVIIIMTLVSAPLLSVYLVASVIMPFVALAYGVAVIPILLIAPIYLFEDSTGLIQAVRKAFKMGFNNLGTLFMTGITLLVLVNVLEFIVFIPWAVTLYLFGTLVSDPHALSAADEAGLLTKAGFSLTSTALCYCLYVAFCLVEITVGFVYGSATQARDDVSLIEDIHQLENL